MSKAPPTLPPNPFARSESFAAPSGPSRSATAGFGDSTSSGGSEQAASGAAPNPFAAKSAIAGFGQGKAVASKALESGDVPHAKKNPFDRKPAIETKKPAEAKPTEPAAAKKTPDAPEVVTTAKGLEVAQVKAVDPEEFAKRVQQAQKPVEIKEVTSANYTQAYVIKEQEKLETKKIEQQQRAEEFKKAEEAKKQSVEDVSQSAAEAQAQLARNAALAHQARELQGKMANLRGQLGQGGDDTGTWAAIEECRIALAQIPTGLQG